MSSMSEKTESEVSSLVESDDSDSEKVIKRKIWKRNDYFTNLNDKWKCKSCDKS
jgi:hypothetical protein